MVLQNAMNAAEITDKLGLHSLRQRAWVRYSASIHPPPVANVSHSTSNLPAPPPVTVSTRVSSGSAPTLGSADSRRRLLGAGFAVVKGWACFLLFVSVPLVVCESRLCLPSTTTLSYLSSHPQRSSNSQPTSSTLPVQIYLLIMVAFPFLFDVCLCGAGRGGPKLLSWRKRLGIKRMSMADHE